MSSLITGFITGLPLAAPVGPIAVLLMESGVERGVRRSVPAALGVVAADLALAAAAVVGGTAISDALAGAQTPLRLLATGVIVWVGLGLLRRPASEVAPANQDARSFGRFLALTLVNPLTLLAFSSIVLAGGASSASLWWAVGIAAGSFVVQVAYVALGAFAGHAVDEVVRCRLRRGAGIALLVLAVVHLAG